MAKDQEPTQETPGGGTIPVPKRKAVFDDLRKVVGQQPAPQENSDTGSGSTEKQQGE